WSSCGGQWRAWALRSRGTVDRRPLYKGIVSDDPECARPRLGAAGERVGKTGWGRKDLRLSTRQGANARTCADSGPRTSACTDICALACTVKNAAKISAGGNPAAPCGKPAQH